MARRTTIKRCLHLVVLAHAGLSVLSIGIAICIPSLQQYLT